jgi:hypothetical protein
MCLNSKETHLAANYSLRLSQEGVLKVQNQETKLQNKAARFGEAGGTST